MMTTLNALQDPGWRRRVHAEQWALTYHSREPPDPAPRPNKPSSLSDSAGGGAALRPAGRPAGGRGLGARCQPSAVARTPGSQRPAWAQRRRRPAGPVGPALTRLLPGGDQAPPGPDP